MVLLRSKVPWRCCGNRVMELRNRRERLRPRVPLQQFLLLACIVQTRSLQPLGSAKEPARRRETAAVLGCDHRLGAVAYGYLQRLGAVHESGLREPVALLKGNMQRRKLSSVLSSAFLGALNPRRA